MEIKHSVMVGMLGHTADRFHEYQSSKDFEQRLAMAKQVDGVEGIEIIYPSEFKDIGKTIQLVKDSGLMVSAVNLNVKSLKQWESGSFTSPDPRIRSEAADELRIAMDISAELGSYMVSCCPLIDGHNYCFEVDYLKQWGWLEEGIAEGLKHRKDVRLSLEYKLNESRNYNILGDMGRALYLCQRLDSPNLGVTMDVGHALIAKETPAEVATFAAQTGRLFYVHFNDNGREWDWDMLPGSVNLWDLIETMYYLDRLDWKGWLSYDVYSRGVNPVENNSAAISIIKSAEKFVQKIGMEQLNTLIADGNPANTFKHLWSALL
jgi:xylose isomerase